jgi:two-component system, OmpR family, sensor histidine kinase CpxA
MRIFPRIFLTFWLTIVVSIGMTVVFALSTFSLLQPLHPRALPIYPIHACAFAVQDEYQRAGLDGLARYLGTARTNCSGGIVVNLRIGHQFADMGPKLAAIESPSAQQSAEIRSVTAKELPFRIVIARPGPLGNSAPGFFLFMRPPYVVFMNSPRSLRTSLVVLLSRIALLVASSGLCCYLLTLYLVKPVIRLGQMAEQLGGGDLGTRIEGPLIARKDELGEFGRKFNQMASEIESLVTRYKHFLAHASHELGSPLTRVNIALGLARKKADPGLAPELNRIGDETKRLNTLVQELLLLARLESDNELDRQTTSFDVASLVDEACADAGFEAAQLGKSVVLQKTGTFLVTGHRELLRRALDNVLRNALRFARESGSVRVALSLSETKQTGMVTIHDDGPGIAPEEEELIFEPFTTLPNNAIGTNQGSGLGLAIARQAVIVNGGRIGARGSESGGLAVTIELPVTGLQSRGKDTADLESLH